MGVLLPVWNFTVSPFVNPVVFTGNQRVVFPQGAELETDWSMDFSWAPFQIWGVPHPGFKQVGYFLFAELAQGGKGFLNPPVAPGVTPKGIHAKLSKDVFKILSKGVQQGSHLFLNPLLGSSPGGVIFAFFPPIRDFYPCVSHLNPGGG